VTPVPQPITKPLVLLCQQGRHQASRPVVVIAEQRASDLPFTTIARLMRPSSLFGWIS